MATTSLEAPPTCEDYDRHIRFHDDETTWFAEVLEGSMRTAPEYRFAGHELYARDGARVGAIFKESIEAAEEIVARDPGMAFELRRRQIEYGEYQDMLAMARGELPNTLVVVSDFPPELMNAREDVGGYDVSRKQTMLRVITRQPGGNITIMSQSLDRSDRQALEAIYAHLGMQPADGELLGQRVHLDAVTEEQPYVIDHLMGAYDRAMAEQYGGVWYAGRQDAQRRNTYEFVCQQADLLGMFVAARLHDPIRAEAMRYDLAAAMQKRFHNRQPSWRVVADAVDYARGPSDALERELWQAGAEARARGDVFSACGATIRAIEEANAREELRQAGYGNKTGQDEDCDFISKKCPLCHARNVKTRVTATHITGSCGCSKKRQ